METKSTETAVFGVGVHNGNTKLQTDVMRTKTAKWWQRHVGGPENAAEATDQYHIAQRAKEVVVRLQEPAMATVDTLLPVIDSLEP